MEPTLSQALHLLNGDTVNNKIQAGGLIDKWMAEQVPPLQIVERLYIATLSRRPTPTERATFDALLGPGVDVKTTLIDTFWALLNSREFIFNH